MRKYISFRLPKEMISFLLDRRAILVTLGLLAAAIALFIVSTGMGTMHISPAGVIKAILGIGSPTEEVVVNKLRLPRVTVALLVGSALALSGAILQGMIRNPLASPDIIGITGGASAVSVLFISVFQKASIHLLPFAAMAGALAATAIIYLLAWKKGVSPVRLVLIGIGINAAMSAITTFLIVRSPMYLTSKALTWMTGSVYGSGWKQVDALLPWFLIFFPLSFVLARAINVQQLGDDLAIGVGNTVQRHRLLLLFTSVALAGSAVAFGGAIGFVGLIAPHLSRRLVGSSYGALLPVSALSGGIIVMAADLVARMAFQPLDLPVGLFTALIGAPFFIYLLYRTRNH
jgi:iron complex transport system permease protein